MVEEKAHCRYEGEHSPRQRHLGKLRVDMTGGERRETNQEARKVKSERKEPKREQCSKTAGLQR